MFRERYCTGSRSIANYAVTTASVHDSQIDLSIPGIVNYKDKGYLNIVEKYSFMRHSQTVAILVRYLYLSKSVNL